tara:strand:- start:719 stop:1087 length:369 start_codon:yes stop_codon:yes gene_type:complete
MLLNLGSSIGLCILIYLIISFVISGYSEFCYKIELVQKLYWYKPHRENNYKSNVTAQETEGFETNREMIPRKRSDSNTIKEGGEIEMMEGGQKINSVSEDSILRVRVRDEIDTHDKIELSNF